AVAKQTGPAHGVKSAIALACVLALLSACASTWHNPKKSAQEAAADEKACAAEAEDTALTRAGRQRVEYGAPSPNMPGMNRGETPMQMRDRVNTEDTYNREFKMCMRSKGYTQDKR